MADHDDRSGQLRAVAITFIPLVCITMALRCYMRAKVIRALGWDDGVMVIALLCYIMHVACVIGGSFYGLGRKLGPDTDFQRIAVAVKYMWIAQLGYGLATDLCKISVCLFLMRLTVKPFHTRLLWILLIYTAVHGAYVILADLVRCWPISYNWNQMTLDPRFEGTCITSKQSKIIAYVATGSLLLIDICLGVILPALIVWKLQMPKQSKLAVLSILCLTVCATVAIVVRIPYMDGYAASDALCASLTPDTPDAAVDMLIWAYIELSLGIIAGNLATLGPLFRIWFGIVTSRGNSASTSTPKPTRYFRRPGGVHDMSFPLSTFDETSRNTLRPDKLPIMVTQVRTQHSHSATAHDANNSQEQLTLDHGRARGPSAASSRELALGAGPEPESRMEIYRETEVMQTFDVDYAVNVAEERV
ncbi:putative integral membrane protein [Aspergillus foveolatus]|uniref:putative integral membrane protein n=1 Tax=Aspergillus foveolatus TaxID=210207 RepID=UPI003CCE04B4